MTREEKIHWMEIVLAEAKWWYSAVDKYLSDRSVTVRLNGRISEIEKMICVEEFMDEQKQVHQAMALDAKGAARYWAARAKQLHAALEFAEKHIKAGKGWDAECDSAIGEALLPTKLPEGFELVRF